MIEVKLARHAMATRFELVLHGASEPALRAAGEEALDEIARLEDELSLFRPTSQIFRINDQAAAGPVRIAPWLFHLLETARDLSAETGGAFDITVAPLLRCWGLYAREGKVPAPEELAAARACVGMGWMELESETFTVRFARPGVRLDLGAIGKGYAVERAMGILREAGVSCALLHGGTSTVSALGVPAGSAGWTVAIEHPDNVGAKAGLASSRRTPPLATVRLRDESLSVSAVWGKTVSAAGRSYGHVIDPRTGAPTEGALLAAVVLPSATASDALSTALLTLGSAGVGMLARGRVGLRALVAERSGEADAIRTTSTL